VSKLSRFVPVVGQVAEENDPAAFSRRQFLLGAGSLGAFVLVASSSNVLKAEEARKYGADAMPHGWRDDPLVFLSIAEDGTVTIVVHRSEMGQGVRTGMPLIVADELEADWSKVRIEQAPGNEEKYGNQDTDGSRSTRHFFDPMRRCAASARTMLEQAAAAAWGVPMWSSARADASWAMARWPRPPQRCPCRPVNPCG
jgi:isoquinoline 1-oxidoreductase beta subunit